jgi:hypothetical protein
MELARGVPWGSLYALFDALGIAGPIENSFHAGGWAAGSESWIDSKATKHQLKGHGKDDADGPAVEACALTDSTSPVASVRNEHLADNKVDRLFRETITVFHRRI